MDLSLSGLMKNQQLEWENKFKVPGTWKCRAPVSHFFLNRR